MKQIKLFLITCSVFALVFNSCKKEEETKADEFHTEEDIESIEESSQLNLEDNYEGIYKGKINGKEVELTLEIEDEQTFKLKEGNSSFNGNWDKVEDGTKIELVSKGNQPKTKYYAWSDGESWIALNSEGNYTDNEEFLIRQK